MLVEETRKVRVDVRDGSKDTKEVSGQLWNLAGDTSSVEEGAKALVEGVASGKLGTWDYVLGAIRHGLRIDCRERILTENGLASPKKSKKDIELEIALWAVANDPERWAGCRKRGGVAVRAYLDQAYTDLTACLDNGQTLTVPKAVELLESGILQTDVD